MYSGGTCPGLRLGLGLIKGGCVLTRALTKDLPEPYPSLTLALALALTLTLTLTLTLALALSPSPDPSPVALREEDLIVDLRRVSYGCRGDNPLQASRKEVSQ